MTSCTSLHVSIGTKGSSGTEGSFFSPKNPPETYSIEQPRNLDCSTSFGLLVGCAPCCQDRCPFCLLPAPLSPSVTKREGRVGYVRVCRTCLTCPGMYWLGRVCTLCLVCHLCRVCTLCPFCRVRVGCHLCHGCPLCPICRMCPGHHPCPPCLVRHLCPPPSCMSGLWVHGPLGHDWGVGVSLPSAAPLCAPVPGVSAFRRTLGHRGPVKVPPGTPRRRGRATGDRCPSAGASGCSAPPGGGRGCRPFCVAHRGPGGLSADRLVRRQLCRGGGCCGAGSPGSAEVWCCWWCWPAEGCVTGMSRRNASPWSPPWWAGEAFAPVCPTWCRRRGAGEVCRGSGLRKRGSSCGNGAG